MKKLLLAMPFVLALVLLSCGLALADNGPHGGFAPATDACAGCQCDEDRDPQRRGRCRQCEQRKRDKRPPEVAPVSRERSEASHL